MRGARVWAAARCRTARSWGSAGSWRAREEGPSMCEGGVLQVAMLLTDGAESLNAQEGEIADADDLDEQVCPWGRGQDCGQAEHRQAAPNQKAAHHAQCCTLGVASAARQGA